MPVLWKKAEQEQQDYDAQEQNKEWAPENRRFHLIDINPYQSQHGIGYKKKWMERDRL